MATGNIPAEEQEEVDVEAIPEMDKLELIRLNAGNQYSILYSSLFRYFIQSNVFPYLSAGGVGLRRMIGGHLDTD